MNRYRSMHTVELDEALNKLIKHKNAHGSGPFSTLELTKVIWPHLRPRISLGRRRSIHAALDELGYKHTISDAGTLWRL